MPKERVMSLSPVTRIVLAATAVAVAGPALAKDGEIKTNRNGEQVICRQIKMTGSRMSKKVCRTAEQWKLVLDDSAKAGNASSN
jgi:hypothetical protein